MFVNDHCDELDRQSCKRDVQKVMHRGLRKHYGFLNQRKNELAVMKAIILKQMYVNYTSYDLALDINKQINKTYNC